MNRHQFNSEENFWPCVSDMFLGFFVIALALYATSNADKGKGDEYISHLAKEEAVVLVNFLHSHGKVEKLTEEERNEKGVTLPKLAKRLYQLLEDPDTCHYFTSIPKDIENSSIKEEKTYSLPDVSVRLYECIGKTFDETTEDRKGPYYHKYLREVKDDIIQKILKEKGGYDALTKSELVTQLKNSVSMLEYKRIEREMEQLKRKYDLIVKNQSNFNALLNDNLKLKDDLEKEKERGDELADRNKELGATVIRLEDEINKDNRKSVMLEIEKLIQKQEYANVREKVEILKEQGVIRIPESVVGFISGSKEPNYGCNENINLISDLLGDIGDMVKNQGLQIDNVSIECHADPTSKSKSFGRIYINRKNKNLDLNNDSLSMLRALTVWNMMEVRRAEKGVEKLADYKNKAGLGLFSTSGFGDRVPVKKNDNETDDNAEFLSRCRRMDIRINCSPEKVMPTK